MYQALYRKWRPRSFDDVVSQPHVTETLKNQIKNGKTAHAYLFTGSRGTGKTTCARIFAKAVNCPNSKDGVPCLECDICKAAENGTLGDIIEIDAASNAKVDDIRELREGVMFTPEVCKYKVYIIDEVHMLSPGAFNALLKTMEEPPPHVKFILATTEIHKVPATIVSRCQHFDFRRIVSEDIVDRLMYIADNEDFSLDKEAAQLIARLSDGGMRDALSLLDQCAALNDKVTVQTVSEASGIAGRDYLFDILEKISDKDAAGALGIVDKLYDLSKDLKVLADELLEQLRNVMLIKTIKDNKELIRCLPEEYERLAAVADKMKLDDILADITVMQGCNERFMRCTSKRIEMEMCLIRLCGESYAKSDGSAEQGSAAGISQGELNALWGKISALENALKNNNFQAAGQAVDESRSNSVQPAANHGDKAPVKKHRPEDYKLAADWDKVVEQVNSLYPGIGCLMKNSKAGICENSMMIILENDFYLKTFTELENKQVVKEILKNTYGKTFDIRVKSAKKAVHGDESDPVNKLLEKAKSNDVEVIIKK